jgi:hypothetical protein
MSDDLLDGMADGPEAVVIRTNMRIAIAAAEDRGYRQAIADLRDDALIERIALATAEHWLTDNQDADRNNICACGEWADSEDNGWDDHMAHIAQDVVADFLESRISQDQPGREEE